MPIAFEQNREILLKYGDNIRKYRTEKCISQSQLAFEVGTTLRQIQRIENGGINAGVLYYTKIAEILEVEIKELLF